MGSRHESDDRLPCSAPNPHLRRFPAGTKRFGPKHLVLVGAFIAALAGCAPWEISKLQDSLLPVAPGRHHTRQLSILDEPDSSLSLPDGGVKDGQLALARLLEKRGQTELAVEMYLALLKQDGRNPLLHHRLGVTFAKQNRFEDAHRHFETALRLSPRNAELVNDRGYAYYLQDRLAEAEQAFRQALALDPDHAMAANNLGLVLGMQRRYGESLAAFRRAVGEAEAHANLAYVCAQQGDLDRARLGYLHALTLDSRLRTAAQALLQIETRLQAGLAAARRQVAAPGAGNLRQPQWPARDPRELAALEQQRVEQSSATIATIASWSPANAQATNPHTMAVGFAHQSAAERPVDTNEQNRLPAILKRLPSVD